MSVKIVLIKEVRLRSVSSDSVPWCFLSECTVFEMRAWCFGLSSSQSEEILRNYIILSTTLVENRKHNNIHLVRLVVSWLACNSCLPLVPPVLWFERVFIHTFFSERFSAMFPLYYRVILVFVFYSPSLSLSSYTFLFSPSSFAFSSIIFQTLYYSSRSIILISSSLYVISSFFHPTLTVLAEEGSMI